MNIIPIFRVGYGYLQIVAKVAIGDERTKTNIPFVVDTGAARTVVLPYYQQIIKKELSTVGLYSANEKIKTLFGDLTVKKTSGLALICSTSVGGEVNLGPLDICFASGELAKRSRKIRNNLLGRSALSGLTLYIDRPGRMNRKGLSSNPIAFLTDDGTAMNELLKKNGPKELRDFLDVPVTGPVEVIHWRG